MYEEQIQRLKQAEGAAAEDLKGFLNLVDKYYDMGLIVQLHSKQDGEDFSYELHLISRVSSSVEIKKIITNKGVVQDWTAFDLSDLN